MLNMRDFFKRNYFLIKLIELSLDFVFIVLSFIIGVQIARTIDQGNFIQSFIDMFKTLFSDNAYIIRTQILYFIVNIFFFNVYQSFITNKSYKETMKSVVLALTMSNITAIILSFLFQHTFTKPGYIGYIFISQILVFSIHKYLFYLITARVNKKEVLIIGTKEEAEKLAIKFLHKKDKVRWLKYVLFEIDKKIDKDIIEYINNVDTVIVSHSVSETNKNNIITYCLSKRYKEVYLVPKLYEVSIVNSLVNQVDDTPVFHSQSMHLSITQQFVKRMFDLILSIILLILASPIMLVVAITMKFTDKGPIFYKQERITRSNKPFILYKFRTMIVDAEKETGPVWQMEDDPRITKMGKFLRKTRIDELPQLINVIKGEMSLIGPRPEREIFIKEFIKDIPDFRYRVNVKPGITGLAQVNGKYNSEPIDKLRFDLIYIRKYSLLLDIKILFLTVKAIFDRDSSATQGLPTIKQVSERRKVTFKPIENGYEVLKND